MVNFHFPMIEIPCPNILPSLLSQNPKCLFFLFHYTKVYLCAKFDDLKPTIFTWSNILNFGPVSEQGSKTTFHKETAIFFQPNGS